MDLAELSEQSSALPDQFWAPKGEAKSAEPTDDRSYLMFKKDQKSEGFVAEFGDESGVPINLAKEKVRKMVIFISPNMSQS